MTTFVDGQSVVTAAWLNAVDAKVNTISSQTTQSYTASSSQTVFTVPTYTPGTNSIEVYLNGVRLTVLADYQETNTTTITLLSPATLGDTLLVQTYSPVSLTTLPATQVSYTYPNSTTTRTVSSKLGESVSVKDFGAACDGVTDDSVAVQAAITSLGSIGGFVLITPNCVYNQASLTIPLNVVLLDAANARMVFAHTGLHPGILDSHAMFRDIRSNNASRLYVVPNGTLSSGTLSAFKMFGTDYFADQTNYQDFGMYLSKIVGTVLSVDTVGETVTTSSAVFNNGDLVRYETTGTPIGGLTANGSYYVVSVSSATFGLAATAGGASINLTSAGTGTHSFTQTTAYINGKVNGTYPQYSIANCFQDGAQLGTYEFPIDTGLGQKMHVALGGGKPSNSVWYDGVRIHFVSDALFQNATILRWLNAEGTSAGFGMRLSATDDLDFLTNSAVVASFLFNGGSPVFKLSKPLVYSRTVGTAGDTAPNVAGINFLQIPSNGSAYNISDFTNAIDGQELTILFSDGSPTITRSTTMRLSGGVNFTGSNGAILTLIKGSAGWFEKSRSVNP